MDQRLTNARHIYEVGIRDGDIDAGLSVIGDRYTQHSAGVPDGPDGFRAFFTDFLDRHPSRDIELVRMLADDDGVFVHAHQRLDDGAAQWVTFDWFDFDDEDRIVEHWDVIAPWVDDLPGGRTSTSGTTEVEDLGRTEQNRATVLALLSERPDHVRVARSCAMGSFVATLSEATRDGEPYAMGDLFRLSDGEVVEEWQAAEAIAPRNTWVNGGKF